MVIQRSVRMINIPYIRIPDSSKKQQRGYLLNHTLSYVNNMSCKRCHVRRYVLTYVTKYEYDVLLKTPLFRT